jgi:hypothetical protein
VTKGEKVERPLKKSEYLVVFGSVEAKKGWLDLLGSQRSHLAKAWMQLTVDPLIHTPKIHSLRGSLGSVTRGGEVYEQRQLELSHGARIWFYVHDRNVVLVKVHTRHPNQTK